LHAKNKRFRTNGNGDTSTKISIYAFPITGTTVANTTALSADAPDQAWQLALPTYNSLIYLDNEPHL